MLALRVRREETGLGLVLPGCIKTGGLESAEKRHQWVGVVTGTLHLQRQVEMAALHFF